MAFNSRLPSRTARIGPQRPKVGGDENAIVSKHVKQSSVVGPLRVPLKTGPQRPALGEVTATAINKQTQISRVPVKDLKEETGSKRARSSSLAVATGPQRIPLAPVPVTNVVPSTTIITVDAPAPVPSLSQRAAAVQSSEMAPELQRKPSVPVPNEMDAEDEDMDIEEDVIEHQVEENMPDSPVEPIESDADYDDELEFEEETDSVPVSHIWPELSPVAAEKYRSEIEHIQTNFHDEVSDWDTTMVSEYSEEIFQYMERLELEVLPNPEYVDSQSELTWEMRQTLIDWLLQVHLRYRLLPETLWIAINLVDRFLSKRMVSVVKLQLVGVIAMFTASKYEEVLTPSIEEFVFMTGNGYTKEEILKGERVLLKALDFKISSYCSPYSWMRRISKADDYDIQTRTLCKFLVEVTLLDYRFLRVKPSLIAAVGMYTSRRMLCGNWDDAFKFYSGYTEEYLIPGSNMILEKLLERDFDKQYVSRKYATKKFLKASCFAIDWARTYISGSADRMD